MPVIGTVYRCPELLASNGLRSCAGRGFPRLTISWDLVNQIDVPGNDVCSPSVASFFELLVESLHDARLMPTSRTLQ